MLPSTHDCIVLSDVIQLDEFDEFIKVEQK